MSTLIDQMLAAAACPPSTFRFVMTDHNGGKSIGRNWYPTPAHFEQKLHALCYALNLNVLDVDFTDDDVDVTAADLNSYYTLMALLGGDKIQTFHHGLFFDPDVISREEYQTNFKQFCKDRGIKAQTEFSEGMDCLYITAHSIVDMAQIYQGHTQGLFDRRIFTIPQRADTGLATVFNTKEREYPFTLNIMTEPMTDPDLICVGNVKYRGVDGVTSYIRDLGKILNFPVGRVQLNEDRSSIYSEYKSLADVYTVWAYLYLNDQTPRECGMHLRIPETINELHSFENAIHAFCSESHIEYLTETNLQDRSMQIIVNKVRDASRLLNAYRQNLFTSEAMDLEKYRLEMINNKASDTNGSTPPAPPAPDTPQP